MARLAEGKGSRTARITAAMRHRHWLGGARPLVFEDPLAHLFLDLPSAMAALPTPLADRALGRLYGSVRGIEGEVLARSRYVEETLVRRLGTGLDQVVVLGAGFDTTALRHVDSACRFFEVDHPATQADKREILSRRPELGANVVFVPVDFAKDDPADALLAAGFDPARPALVSWLGVTMYLEQRVTLATLVTLRRILARGSSLIFDAYPRREETVMSERPMFAAARAMTAAQGEPMIGAFDSSEFEKAIRGKGWRIADVVNGDAMRRRWFANQPRILWPPRSVLFYTLEAV
ncbi:MAG TPA: class I SAM-dependent methyltransferase [Caldimonas sp.]|nr:class I SAM-dependent methyltransferase [Caldimonas sp.]